ncbi:MAG TPA: hypothetical protein VH643_33975 [Gemmataceae bacterium]|jgi:hypothetical protein
MPEGADIGVLLCALVIGLAVGTLIGAVFLRAAVALYNKLAGGASSPSSVPEPTFGKAMWITFAISLAQMVLGYSLIAAAAGAGGQGAVVVAQFISVPVSLLISAEILSAKLPTTFGRAILVTLCDMLLVLIVLGVLVGIAVLVFGVALR